MRPTSPVLADRLGELVLGGELHAGIEREDERGALLGGAAARSSSP